MNKFLIIAILILLLFASTAHSGGQWDHMYENSGTFDWSYYHDVSWVALQKIVAVGYFQGGLTAVETVWKSLNGGSTFNATRIRTGLNPCTIINGLGVIYGVDYFTPGQGVFVGGSISPLCTGILPFPECMICLLDYDPTIWHSTDDGATLNEERRDLFNFYKAYLKVQAINSTHGWACGTGNQLAYAVYQDSNSGYGWSNSRVMPESSQDVDYLDLHFLDTDSGYVVASMQSHDDKRKADYSAENPYEIFDLFIEAKTSHERIVSPTLRLHARRLGIKQKEDYMWGKVYYTTSAGNGWAQKWVIQNAGITKVSFSSQKRGLIATDEVSDPDGAQFKIYYTDSDGYAWTQATIPQFGPSVGGPYDIGDLVMVTSGFGFIAGAEDDGTSSMTGFMLYTIDGGKNWQPMPTQPNYPIYSFDFKDRTLGFAVGENRITLRFTGTNSHPIADAGPNQTRYNLNQVTLDASDSEDHDDLDLEFEWSQISGPSVNIAHLDFPVATFTPATYGTYVFEVRVEDGVAWDTDRVKIFVIGTNDDDDVADDDDDVLNDDDTNPNDDDSIPSDDDATDDDTQDQDDDSAPNPDGTEDEWGAITEEEGSGGCCG